jgi:zinc protease
MVTIMMDGDYKYTFENNLVFKTLEKVLSIKLREQMREEESGTYGVSARKNLDKYPKEEYGFSISFGCAPENVDKLVKIIFTEIENIQKNGPEEKDMLKAKETFLRERETRVKENKYWLNKLMNVSFLSSKVISDEEYNNAVNAVTADQVKDAANKYLTLDHYVYGVLKPVEQEKGK